MAGPWEAYAAAPPPTRGPWESFKAADARETKTSPSLMGDVGMAIVGAPQEAVARLAGAPQGMLDLAQVPDKAARWLLAQGADLVGADDYAAILREPKQRVKVLPDTEDIKSGVDKGINAVSKSAGGEGQGSIFYKPQTPQGKIALEATTGALGGGPAGKLGALSGFMGGLVGETGAQTVAGTPLEPWVRAAGNVAAGASPFVARSMLSVARPGEVLAEQMSDVTKLPSAQQDHVVNLAQQIMDEGRQHGVTVLGPEAYAQAMAESRQGAPDGLMLLQRKIEQSRTGRAFTSPVIGARPQEVRQAGDNLMDNTFGGLVDAEGAVQQTQKAAEKTLTDADRARTAATQADFSASKATQAPLPEINTLIKDVDAQIQQSGEISDIGRELKDFRAKLMQGVEGRAQLEHDMAKAGIAEGSTPWKKTLADAGITDERPLGPLVTTNREYADRLNAIYDPTAGTAQAGFNKTVGGVIGPLNTRLTDILKGASPDYKKGLEDYAGLSQPIDEMYESGLGRLNKVDKGDVGGRLTTMSSEFLSPETNPARIRTLASQLGKSDPEAVKNLVGARVRSLFNQATAKNVPGENAFGGARFVKDLMGNRQQAENLRATIEALPNGQRLWPAWQKLTRVLEATGKRLPRGSDTEVNQALASTMKGSGGTLVKGGFRPLKYLGDKMDEWSVNRVGHKLGEVFTHPEAAKKMLELAVLDPQKQRAQLVAAQVLNLLDGPEGKDE